MNKMIHGNVNSNGTKKTGYDFKVNKVAAGKYIIDFSIPFPDVPTLIVTQVYPDWDKPESEGGDTRDNAIVVAVTESQAKIKTGECYGKAADRNFSFLAICEIPT